MSFDLPPHELQAHYPPRYYLEQDQQVLIAFMREITLATIVTQIDGNFYSTALPLLADQRDGQITLSGHLPAVNPQTLALHGAKALVIFQGPQAYVRPGWYPSKQRDPRTVPTWNYVTVKAQGTVETTRERAFLLKHLNLLTVQCESAYDDPWTLNEAPAVFISQMVGSLVGFTLRVDQVTGIWKNHQNHPQENRLGVIEGLRQTGDPQGQAIADAMEQREQIRRTQHK